MNPIEEAFSKVKGILRKAAAFLRMPFTLEKASSMGFMSGEQGGRNSSVAPASSMSR